MARSMRILVDVDGILADTLPSWLQRIYEMTGIKASISDVTRWNLNENPPLDQLTLTQILDPLNEKGFNLNLPPLADADKVLERLYRAGHDISIVTARHGATCIAETIEWLEKWMPWLDHKKVWFVHDKHRVTADAIIDDKAEYLIEYQKTHPGAHLITIDYPYNQHAPAETHRVFKNGHEWEQIERVINELSNNQ